VFAQTTHVVAAPHGFACVVIPATPLYIPSFIEIRSGVSEPQGIKIWPFPLLWLALLQQLVLPYKYYRTSRDCNTTTTTLHPVQLVLAGTGEYCRSNALLSACHLQ